MGDGYLKCHKCGANLYVDVGISPDPYLCKSCYEGDRQTLLTKC